MKTKCSSRTSIPIIVIKHVFDEDYSLSHSYMFTESFSGKTVFKLISIEKLQSTPKSKKHDVPYIPRIAECLGPRLSDCFNNALTLSVFIWPKNLCRYNI